MKTKIVSNNIWTPDKIKEVLSDLSKPIGSIKVQEALKQLFKLNAADWRIGADFQNVLRARFYEIQIDDWKDFQISFEKDNAHSCDSPIDLQKDSWKIGQKEVKEMNLEFLFGPNMYEKYSKTATAGVRHLVNVVHGAAHDPRKLYSDTFVAVHAKALAKFIKEDLYPALQNKFRSNNVEDIRNQIGIEMVSIVEQAFGGMEFNDVYELLKTQPVFVVSGETRPHTERFVEIQSRILAAEGILVITSKDYSSSNAVNIVSLLTQLLGAAGGSMWTSSHSSVDTGGDKIMGPNGGQLLAEVYEKLVLYCMDNLQVANSEDGLTIAAPKENSNIFQTIDYAYSAHVMKTVLNPSKEEVEYMNKALSHGFSCVINCVNGAGYHAVKNYLKAIGIEDANINKITFLHTSEKGPETGFLATKDKDKYSVIHDGTDMTRPSSLKTVNYHKYADFPVGTFFFEFDNDVDRFTMGQLISKDQIAEHEKFAVTTVELNSKRAMSRYSPNKSFLTLDKIDFDQKIKPALEDDTTVIHLHTIVSGDTWKEMDEDLQKKYPDTFRPVYCRTGFKNLKTMLDIIDNWFYKTSEPTLTIVDQGGVERIINRRSKLLIVSLEEESGGRGSGYASPLQMITGDATSASPEKSAIDSFNSTFAWFTKQYCNSGYNQQADSLSQLDLLKRAHSEHNLKSLLDTRVDARLTTTRIIGNLQSNEAAYTKKIKELELIRDHVSNFVFSLAKHAHEGGDLNRNTVIAVLKEIMPELSFLFDRLDIVLYMDEKISDDEYRPEGAYFRFQPGGILTALKFRPSLTDITFGNKWYLDSDGKTSEADIMKLIKEKMVDRLIMSKDLVDKGFTLNDILEKYNIKSVIPLAEADRSILIQALKDTTELF